MLYGLPGPRVAYRRLWSLIHPVSPGGDSLAIIRKGYASGCCFNSFECMRSHVNLVQSIVIRLSNF